MLNKGKRKNGCMVAVRKTLAFYFAIKSLYASKYNAIMGENTAWTFDGDDVPILSQKAKEAGFSYYGMRDEDEFVSEAIAQYYCSAEPCEIIKEMINILLEG